ncbi:sensor histidine kinase [Asticcacaulis excentricus]|nr:ATP-binding protein [Asticcacaulis excentricus]
MMWQKLLRQQRYYPVLFVLLSIATVAFSFIVYAHYNRIQDQNRQSLFEYEAIRQSRVVLVDLLDMQTGVHAYLISGDEATLTSYRTARDMLERDLSAYRSLVLRHDPQAARDIYLWLDNIRSLRKTFDDQIENRRLGRGAALTREAFERQVRDMAHVRRALEATNVRRLVDVRLQTAEVGKARSDFVFTLVIGSILLIGVMLLGTVTILNLEADFRNRLAEQEAVMQRYREVTEGINDGLFEVNFVSGDVYCSAAYKAMLGYAPDEVENRWEVLRDMIHPDDREAADADLRRYMEGTDATYRSIFRMRHKDGGYRWILSRGVGTGADFSGIKSMIGTHADITEQKQREEELRQLYADLETFTYITSHDLRAPLVNLKGFSKELEISMKAVTNAITPYQKDFAPEHQKALDLALKEDVPESLGFIAKGVERMDSLTRAILDLSRIGKRVYAIEPVNTQTIFDKCVGALGYDITQKGIEIRCDPLPEIMSDAVALEQIFGNLLDNAVKYLRPDITGKIDVSVRETLHDYIFTVSDNGRGIADIDKPKVFEIFRRARNTTEVGGLGLGMAYVKATLRRLSGDIWFDSKIDEGTRFHVRLPKRPRLSEASRPVTAMEA